MRFYGKERALFIILAFCLAFLSGCKAFSDTFSVKPPPFATIHVKPWRIINRAPVGYPGGNLRVMEFGSTPKTFNPITANDQTSNDITEQIFSALLDVDFRTGKVVPALAYKWTHSKDGKVWTFYLRQGLRWSDGAPLTADDVVFTMKAIYDPKVPNPSISIMEVNGKPFRCVKVNDTTVKFILPAPYGPFPFAMATLYVVPKHVLEKSLEDGTFATAYGVNSSPDQIVCSGAFRILDYVPQERVILERNPYFYAKDIQGQRLPYLDHIIVIYVKDWNTEFLKFISGDADAICEFPPSFYDDLKAGEKRGDYHIVDLGPTAETQFVMFNENPHSKTLPRYKLEWFTNPLFRQAVAYSINRANMIRLAYLGRGYRIKEDFHPHSPFYDPNVISYHYAPQKARQLFKEAGFYWKNGKMYDKDGHRVAFDLITNSGNIFRAVLGELFKEDMEKMGIDVEFHPIDFNELINKTESTFDFDAVLLGLINTGGDIEPSNNQNMWLSSGYTHMWYPMQKVPATPWEAEIDKLVNEGLETLDFKERKAIYGKMEEILYEEAPFILLPVPADLYAFRNDIGNADPTYEGRFWTNCPDDMLMAQVYIKKGNSK
jgi:peptide/nickel transport system substrate-binding protein